MSAEETNGELESWRVGVLGKMISLTSPPHHRSTSPSLQYSFSPRLDYPLFYP
jgi:hypothetical protein